MGDVVELDQLAQFECGVDRSVAEPPARIRLEPVAGLGEIVASAEIGERFERPFLDETFEVTAAAFERGLTCRKAARAQHCREPCCAERPECSGLVMVPKLTFKLPAIDTVIPTMSGIFSARSF